MKLILHILLGLLALIVPVTAHAQRPGPMPDMTQEQFVQRAADRFAAMDKNGDGVLTASESNEEQGRPRMRPEVFDANRDGSITREEYNAGVRSRFEQMDADHNGVVTAPERRAMLPEMGGRGRPD